LALALITAALGCGDDDTRSPGVPPDGDEDAGLRVCTDVDNDGYGKYCSRGNDCDDNDPNITDECRRCVRVAKDCPCPASTLPVSCDPPTQRVDGGILVCEDGTRYCRDGYWSDCELVGNYVFIPNR
jgi:hypothetical protein